MVKYGEIFVVYCFVLAPFTVILLVLLFCLPDTASKMFSAADPVKVESTTVC